MTCPACQVDDNRVVDSRSTSAGIMRRRHCRACGGRWTTIEWPAALAPPVKPVQEWLIALRAATTAAEQALAKVAAVLNDVPNLDARTHPFQDVSPAVLMRHLKRRSR